MPSRLELQTLLETLIGSRNVYFQPPPTLTLNYPCIVYSLDKVKTGFGDNKPYIHDKRYRVISIDKNPDSTIPDKIAELPKCVFDRPYSADNLNHNAYILYY